MEIARGARLASLAEAPEAGSARLESLAPRAISNYLARSSTITTKFFPSTVANLLLNGNNLLAVEIHQAATNSSDISLDLELCGTNLPPDVDTYVIHPCLARSVGLASAKRSAEEPPANGGDRPAIAGTSGQGVSRL